MLPAAPAGNSKVGEFLGKDFSSAEARASAAKNAFALLGQHRWGPAAGACLFRNICFAALVCLPLPQACWVDDAPLAVQR